MEKEEEREGLEIRVKNNKFRAPFDQKCTNYHKSAYFSISRTDAHDRLDDMSIHHPSNHKCFQAFSQRSAEKRFAMERMATRGFGAKKIAAGREAIDNGAVGGFFEQ